MQFSVKFFWLARCLFKFLKRYMASHTMHCQHCKQESNKLGSDWRDSTVSKVLTLLVVNPSLIPDISYRPWVLPESDPWEQNQEMILSTTVFFSSTPHPTTTTKKKRFERKGAEFGRLDLIRNSSYQSISRFKTFIAPHIYWENWFIHVGSPSCLL